MKNKNSGFSLFTVLIAVAFLSIMGLLLLYIAVANFEMQTTDLKGKDSFYTAEQALEEIRTGLQEDVGKAMSEAYLSVMESYNADDSTTEESLDDLRHTAFTKKYLTALTGYLSETTTTVSGDDTSGGDASGSGESLTETKKYSLQHLKDYVDLFDTITESENLVITNPTGTEPEMEVGTESGVLLKNIKVIYRDERGRSSIIQTDIRLGIPNIEFPTPSTLPDLMNMIVVADSGIVCENSTQNPNAEITINGSVYAGLITTTDETTGVSIQINDSQTLNITGGDQVVCEGEVQADAGSTFTTADTVNLWASGISLSGSQTTVELLGKTYIADDLTVGSGSGSKVTISGEYYGYGAPDSARASHNNYDETTGYDPNTTENSTAKGVLDSVSDASLSSSIIINGKNTTLDLSGLTRLMLAGRTYVGGSAVTTTTDTTSNYTNSSAADVLMGESVTVKGTQIAYLLPAGLLKSPNETYTGTLTNPMSYTQYKDSGIYNCVNNGVKNEEDDTTTTEATGSTANIVDWNTAVDAWGGKKLSEIGVDEKNPVKAVFYADNSSGGYVYFYLNFTDETKAAEFMQTCYAQEDVKSLMDEYLAFYFPNNDSGITLKDSETYLRYITAGNYLVSGNIVTYEGDTDSIGSGNLLSSDESSSLFETQKGYQNMWFALNRKMIASYDLLETEVEESAAKSHNETDANRSVFDNLVNESAMVEFIYTKGDKKEGNTYCSYEFTNSSGQTQAIFADNAPEGSSKTVTVEDENGNETSKTYNGLTSTDLVITEELASTLRLVVCTGDVKIKSGVKFSGIIMAKGKITLEAGASMTSTPIEAAKVFQEQTTELGVAPRDFFWDGDDYVLGNSSDSSTTSSSGSQSDTYDISDAISYENWKKM